MSSPGHLNTPGSGQGGSPGDQSAESSAPASRGGSRPPKEKHRVRFTPGGESLDTSNHRAAFDVRDDSSPPSKGQSVRPLSRSGTTLGHTRSHSNPSIRHATLPEHTEDIAESRARAPVRAPRPSIMRLPSSDSDVSEKWKGSDDGGLEMQNDKKKEDEEDVEDKEDEEDENAAGKAFSQQSAQQRAERLSRVMGSHSAPGSRYASPARPAARSPPPSPPPEEQNTLVLDLDNIPLQKLTSKRTKYGIEDDTDEEDEDNEKSDLQKKPKNRFQKAAARLIRHHTKKETPKLFKVKAETPPLRSGQVTPVYERDPDDYVPRPKEFREGYLSSIMKLYNEQGVGSAIAHIPAGYEAINRASNRRGSSAQSLIGSGATTPAQTPAGSPTESGTASPKSKHQKWYYKNEHHRSTGSIADLVSSSTMLAQPGASNQRSSIRPKPKYRPRSSQAIDTIMGKKKKPHRLEDSIRIQVHIAETMQRQGYLLKICRALMTYGAPTHRLEEYMRMSARVLEIDGQFLYIPGCMIVSFDDAATHTTEVKLVRSNQGVNLGKLRDTHEVYKEVVHDLIGVEEAMRRLDSINSRKNTYSPWFLVMVYGLASAFVGPFAFGARPIDVPIAFTLGCLLGIMQLIIAPRSELYSNIFEISAAVLTSFLARAFGSINHGSTFCFSALAQSSIALILPGYTVLCGSLELQSRNIVAGSVRMVYAIIYSLFLGFGITVGTSFYGWADRNASSATTCATSMPSWFGFIFVPPFTLCLIVINQGKVKQMPVMLAIAFAGYIVNHFSAIRFSSNAQIANTLGALAIGVLGNMYSRLRHGLAAAALLPAIFVQVPSGLAASGSLISGVTSANQITNQTVNGTAGNGTTNYGSGGTGLGTGVGGLGNSAVLNVGYSMIQVAIGITVGLFLSALVVYPFGKRRSGLFSF